MLLPRSWRPSPAACSALWLLALVTLVIPDAARAEDWEPEIRRFEEADRRDGVGRVDAVLFGSSSFRLWKGLETAFPGLRLLNRGFGGCELSDLNQYFDRVVVPHRPPVLLIYGGDNDIARGKSAAVVARDFIELVARARKQLPDTHVVFVSIKASPSREKFRRVQDHANARVRRFARWHRNVTYLDLVTPTLSADGRPDPKLFVKDMLHLNEAGYAIWQGPVDREIRRRR